MLNIEQLKDLALLQTHRATQLEIMLARAQGVNEQLAKDCEQLRGMLPKDSVAPFDPLADTNERGSSDQR